MPSAGAERTAFGLLGPVAAWRGGEPVSLGGERQRALLAVMLLRANTLVSSERLADLLFSGRPAAMRVAISRLRRVLGPTPEGADIVSARPGGYVLRIDTDALDALRFDRLLAEGRSMIASGEVRAGSAQLRTALALWRGPPLADLTLVECLQDDIRRLEQLRLMALIDRIDADLTLGEGAVLVPELKALVSLEPLHERLRGQLMQALYRSGLQTEALDVYRQFADEVRERLGLDPGPELIRLERQILTHDPALTPGGGHRAGLQGRDTDRPAAAPGREEPRSTAPRSRLPARGPRVLGRDRELDELAALISDPSVALLTLTGSGGSGKTTLGIEAARRAEASFSDGAAAVWLAELSDPSQVPAELARALSVEVSSHELAIQTLTRVLRSQERLLLVDNFEHVIAAASTLAQLVRECPQLTLLVTSRAPLHVDLERVYRVDGLASPASSDDVSASSLRHWPASALFLERAGAAAAEYELDRDDAIAIAELCRYLGGLPLALELAAAPTGVLPPREILRRLRRSAASLGAPRRNLPERQRTIRATIEWSLGLLTNSERRIFGRLAAFAGGFTIDAAEAVNQDIDQSIVEGVARLLDHGLVYRRRTGSAVRLALLEPILAHARELLDSDPACETVIRRHAEHYASFAEAADAELASGDPTRCLERLDHEYPNFRAALDRANAQPTIDCALRIASALGDYVFIRGLIAEQRPWLARALAQPPGDPQIRARALFVLGWLADEDGEHEQATAALEGCLALCTHPKDASLIAQCEAHIACNAWYRGHPERSAHYAARALATSAEAGDPRTEAIVLLLTGYCASTYEDARTRCQRALALFQSLGNRIWPSKIKANLAKHARRAGDHPFARQLIGESIAEAAPVWGSGLRAQNDRELGLIELSDNQHAQARIHLGRSLELCRSIGDRRDLREVLVGLAALETDERAAERAAMLLAAARTLLETPLDVRESLQGRHLSPRQLDTVAATAANVRPLDPTQLDAVLRDASEQQPTIRSASTAPV